MAVWMVRAGRQGERESMALEKGLALIGWDAMPDVSPVKSVEEMRELQAKSYPQQSAKSVVIYAGQIWTFAKRIDRGDIIVMPRKHRNAVAIGKVTGLYKFLPENSSGARHARGVNWIRTDVPRGDFGQDLLSSLAQMTVCQIKRNHAEERIAAMLAGARDPQLTGKFPVSKKSTDGEPDVDDTEIIDLEAVAGDQIQRYIAAKFKSHDLARLVTAILEAQGYQASTSSPGADGGVDILAGQGPMGFDRPRLCVQVKSQESPVDVSVLRELQGVMKNFGAEQGLLAAWGGFKDTVYKEARTKYFEIRLWDASEIVQELLDHYDKLSEEIRAELPLKRVWALAVVPEE